MSRANYITDPAIAAAREAREKELLAKDYTYILDLDRLYEGLGVSEIKYLYTNSPSFKQMADKFNQVADASPFAGEVDETNIVALFRALPEWQQKIEIKKIKPELKAIIDADYDRFSALTPEEQAAGLSTDPPRLESPDIETHLLDQDELNRLSLEDVDKVAVNDPDPVRRQSALDNARSRRAQAEIDRLAAEAQAAVVPVAEVLPEGVEKIGEGSYKLTVAPVDGSNAEIFYGKNVFELFGKLRTSKAHATARIRRTNKKVQIKEEMKVLGEVINYPTLVSPINLTPDQIFSLTERREKLQKEMNDPSRVIEARKELRKVDNQLELASLTFEECEVINRPEIERRRREQYSTAALWIKDNPEFNNVPENIEKFQDLMTQLNWGVTYDNMDKAFEILKEQDVLLSPLEDESSSRPIVLQPASVVPVVTAVPAAAVAAPAVPVVTSPTAAASASALPAAAKVLRPGSSTTATMPTRRIESAPAARLAPVLTVEEYRAMPAAEAKRRYLQDPSFKAGLDALIASGKV